MKNLVYLLVLSIVFTACEDVIDVDLDQGESQLVVDAFVTSDSSIQYIRLTKSADYFLNAPTPAVVDAQVRIVGPANQVYTFVSNNNGDFTYNPMTNGPIDSIGFPYRLEITYNNIPYQATSILNPVPPIDSITSSFEEAELGAEEGYYAQFWARDFAGREDYYWIKSYRNNLPLYPNDPSIIILSQDAAFGGNAADGFVFILPLRAAITDEEEPYIVGDTASVEIFSINKDVFEFLEQASIQANNGGLFSTPPANIRSNIKDGAGNAQEEVLGVFSMSAVSRASKIIEP